MKKINPFTGIAILMGLIGIILFWLRVDPYAVVLLLFFLFQGLFSTYQLFQKKLLNNSWGYVLLLLNAIIVLTSIRGLIIQQASFMGIVVLSIMHSLIYSKIYPKRSRYFTS
jgi:hypothetical protein